MGFLMRWIVILLATFPPGFSRLPWDVLPVNTLNDVNQSATKVAGIHEIVQLGKKFYITSRNHVYSLQISRHGSNQLQNQLNEVIHWPSDTVTTNLCKQKTRRDNACHNFIRIFLPKNESTHVFIVCGTNAFQPLCRNYRKTNETFVMASEFSGTLICPYDPEHTGASLYADDNLYAGTVGDFLGRKPLIYRYADDNKSKSLESTKQDETLLNDPWFIRLVENGPKVFIFFRERAIEDNSGLVYSRVAQVCKMDQGGEHILRKQFTSFQKARLNCSFPGEPPFYFNEISAITDFIVLPSAPGYKVLFAAMNTPRNSIWGSAVCAFLHRDIENSFNQPFLEKHDSHGVIYWSEMEQKPINNALHRCSYNEEIDGKRFPSVRDLQFIRSHPFKSHAVPSWSGSSMKALPLFMRLDSRYQFSSITIETNAGTNGLYTAMFIGTTDGHLLKVVPKISTEVQSYEESFIFVSEQLVYSESQCSGDNLEHDSTVRSVKVDKESGFILVSFLNCIISVPVCPVTSTCKRLCIAAQDPYCAWDGKECVSIVSPQSLEQDVLNGDVSGLPECEKQAIGVNTSETETNRVNTSDGKYGPTRKSVKVEVTTTTTHYSNITAIAAASTFSSGLTNGFIGFAIGVALMVFPILIYCFIMKSRKRKEYTNHSPGNKTKTSEKKSKTKNNSVLKRNGRNGSQKSREESYSQKDLSVERKRSRKSESSVGSNKEISVATSPDRETFKRQASKESGHSDNVIVSPDDNYPQISRQNTFPQSPIHDFPFQRTLSIDAAASTMMPNTQTRNGRRLQRNLSLQMPKPEISMDHHYYTSSTPMSYRPQNPYMKPLVMESPSVTMPSWQPIFVNTATPVKSIQEGGRNYQTTSLDRKSMREARSYTNPQLAHPTEGKNHPPYIRSDTYPTPMKDEKQVITRKRYQSESSGRPSQMFTMKLPAYSSIEEENLPLMEQEMAPTITPMPPRPDNLPLMKETVQYNNPHSPMKESHPFFVKPQQHMGYTLPVHLHRQSREMSPSKQKNAFFIQQQSVDQSSESFPYFVQSSNLTQKPNDKQSRSNPPTPEWDEDYPKDFLMASNNSQSSARNRNPSGASQGTPSSSSLKSSDASTTKTKVLKQQSSFDEERGPDRNHKSPQLSSKVVKQSSVQIGKKSANSETLM